MVPALHGFTVWVERHTVSRIRTHYTCNWKEDGDTPQMGKGLCTRGDLELLGKTHIGLANRRGRRCQS